MVSRPDKRRGRGASRPPSPVKAAAAELGIPVSDDVDDVLDAGVDLARGRRLRPHHQAARARRRADGEPALLAAAPVAGRGAGRAGDPRRRRAHRRVRDGRRGGPRHRRRVRPGRGRRSGRRAPRRELRDQLVEVGSRLLVDTLRAGLGEPAPQEGEATYAEKLTTDDLAPRLDATRRASSTGWSGSAGPGRPCRGQRLKVHAATPSRRARAPARLASCTATRSRPARARCASSRCSPRARPGCRSRLGQRRPPGRRRAAGRTRWSSPADAGARAVGATPATSDGRTPSRRRRGPADSRRPSGARSPAGRPRRPGPHRARTARTPTSSCPRR